MFIENYRWVNAFAAYSSVSRLQVESRQGNTTIATLARKSDWLCRAQLVAMLISSCISKSTTWEVGATADLHKQGCVRLASPRRHQRSKIDPKLSDSYRPRRARYRDYFFLDFDSDDFQSVLMLALFAPVYSIALGTRHEIGTACSCVSSLTQ